MTYCLAEQPQVPEHRRHAVALVQEGRTVTFDELDERAWRFATGAMDAGLVPGDRVLVLAPNAPEFFEVLIGCARAGLVTVPVNWRLAPTEARAVAIDAGARAVIIDPSLTGLAEAFAGDLDLRLHLTLGPNYDSWRRRVRAVRRAAIVNGPHPVVMQVYTSGTSGRPKGVLLNNANLSAKVPRVTPRWGLTPASTSLLATPLFHVGAISWGLAGLYAGATTVLVGNASPETLLGHLADDRVSHTFLVPAMINRLCRAAAPGARFPDLQAIVYGASPISEEDQRAALDLFGPVLHQVYGLSETTGAVAELPADPALTAGSPLFRSTGRPYPWVELEIRDPRTGAPLPPGTPGEVWTRSEQNSPGYFRMPAETAALITDDGWLRTGDGGYLDEQGHLFLTDRVKDMVITGGENVYPAEVEEVLRGHPAVEDVAVFGVPDEQWGEAIVAAVVTHAGRHPDPAELVAFTNGRLAGYKRPRLVVIVDALPKTATGKVQRRRLKEMIG